MVSLPGYMEKDREEKKVDEQVGERERDGEKVKAPGPWPPRHLPHLLPDSTLSQVT